MYRNYRFRQPSGGGGGGAIILLLLLIMLPMMAALAYLGYQKFKGEDGTLGPGPGPGPAPAFKYKVVNGVPQYTEIVPSDCSGTEYVKKKSCHNRQTGDLLDGTANKCGEGVEEWILDPDASGYQRAAGNGTCESDFRPCNVVCDKPCEGATWIEGECMRDGVVLDGSETDKCGRGMRTYTLDENAPDYVASTGRGTCMKTYSSACDVECPQNAVAPPSCVQYTTEQKSANGCVVSKEDGAASVGYDQDGWQEYFQIALEAENCTGEKRLSRWDTCKGPPAPVNCVGTWGENDGWGPCTGSCGAQPTQSRTYTHKPAAANGGEACAIADGAVETRNCGTVQPCCEVGEWQDGTCASDGFMIQTRKLTENTPGACANYDATKDVRCCYQGGDWTAQGTCAQHQSGKQKYTQTVAGNCPSGTDTKYEDCKNCQGYYSDPACPTECGQPASTLTRQWVTRVAKVGTGAACPPSTSTKTCPATGLCPIDVNKTYKIKYGGDNCFSESGYTKCQTTQVRLNGVITTKPGDQFTIKKETTGKFPDYPYVIYNNTRQGGRWCQVDNDKYFHCPINDANVPNDANRTWERFNIEPQGNNTYKIKSNTTGQYCGRDSNLNFRCDGQNGVFTFEGQMNSNAVRAVATTAGGRQAVTVPRATSSGGYY